LKGSTHDLLQVITPEFEPTTSGIQVLRVTTIPWRVRTWEQNAVSVINGLSKNNFTSFLYHRWLHNDHHGDGI